MADVTPVRKLGRKAPDIELKGPLSESVVLTQANIGAPNQVKGTPILNSQPVKKEWWRK